VRELAFGRWALARRECLSPVGVASPSDRAVVFDGPDVGDAYRDLGAADSAAAGLADDGDQVVAVFDDVFWIDRELVEALEPGVKVLLEGLSAAAGSARCGRLVVPIDVGGNECEGSREIVPVERAARRSVGQRRRSRGRVLVTIVERRRLREG
jgi:hypothetical protein